MHDDFFSSCFVVIYGTAANHTAAFLTSVVHYLSILWAWHVEVHGRCSVLAGKINGDGGLLAQKIFLSGVPQRAVWRKLLLTSFSRIIGAAPDMSSTHAEFHLLYLLKERVMLLDPEGLHNLENISLDQFTVLPPHVDPFTGVSQGPHKTTTRIPVPHITRSR